MVKLLSCPDPDQLKAIAVGVLPSGGAEDMIEHLEQCASCATRLSAITADDPLVAAVRAKQAVADSRDQDAVSGLVAKVRALVARPKSTDPTLDSAASAGLSGDTGALSWADQPTPPEPEDDGLAPALAADELGRLGTYRVLKVLGEGGMGKVFLAEDPNLQRFVALKMMKASVAKNRNARQRFLREARLAAKIEHDHIVHIYQVGEDRGIPFLAMQLLKGASLEDLLSRCKVLNVKQVLRIGIQTAQGLAAAHEHGMIHRDIKPGNIWIEPTGGGRVKILDFGLARTSQGEVGITQSGTILGTPAYMPPEQARGEKVDQRCDLYSLG